MILILYNYLYQNCDLLIYNKTSMFGSDLLLTSNYVIGVFAPLLLYTTADWVWLDLRRKCTNLIKFISGQKVFDLFSKCDQ